MAYIEKRNDSYRITVSVGYDNKGKQIRRYKTVKPPITWSEKRRYQEAVKEAARFEEECFSGGYTKGNIRFSEYKDYWLACKKTVLKKSTYTWYSKYINWAAEELGNIPLAKLKAVDINKYYQILLKDGKTPSTIKAYHGAISSMLSFAYKEGVIPNKITDRVSLPKVEYKEGKSFDTDDLLAFFKALPDEPIQYRTIFIIAITMGLRLGEVMGITEDAINFDDGFISVKRTLNYDSDNGMYFDTPKSKKSIRRVALPDFTKYAIQDYIEWKEERRLLLGDYYKNNPDYFFVQPDGKPIHYTTVWDVWQRFLKNNDIERIRFHDLRHTNATIISSTNDISVKTVQEHMGHAQISTTFNIYADSLSSEERKTAAFMDDFIKGLSGQQINA